MNLFAAIKNWLTGSAYDGANTSPKRSYNWRARLQPARFDATKAVRIELAIKSRDFDRNCGLYNKLCDIFELYTVGSGLQMSPASSNPEWNQRAKEWLTTWGKYADANSRQSIDVLESLFARLWFVDGECFILLTNDPVNNKPRIQVLETNDCETPDGLTEEEGKTVVDGVKIDPNGRPIGYYFKGVKDPIDASNVVHIFEPSRPKQYRGLPFCTPVINDLQDLWEIDMLEMESAKEAARITNVIKTKTGEAPSFDTMRSARFGIGPSVVTPADGSAADRAAGIETATGVKTVALQINEEMQQFVSNRPSVVTQAYYEQREEKVCAGIGIPRILVFPGKMQGTVYRGALDMANMFFRARFMVLSDAMKRVYEHVMGWGKNYDTALKGAPADWFKVSIAQPRAVNVDVGYNSAAMIAEFQAGFINLEHVYGPRGQDWREEVLKIKEQMAFLKANQIELPGLQTSPEPQPQGAA